MRAHRLASVGFRRQHAIGKFVVDFCAPSKKLIIEVDGSHHLKQMVYDSARTDFLESKGYRVIRFTNAGFVQNIEGVLEAIFERLGC